MAKGSAWDGDAPGDAPNSAHRPLLLLIASGEPVRGSILPAEGGSAVVFRGWIDLILAIRRLRTHPVTYGSSGEKTVKDHRFPGCPGG